MLAEVLEAGFGVLVTGCTHRARGQQGCRCEPNQTNCDWPVRPCPANKIDPSGKRAGNGARSPTRKKRAPENRSLYFLTQPASRQAYGFSGALQDLARYRDHLGHGGFEALPGKTAVEFANLLRLGNEGFASLLGEFDLHLD